MKGHIMSETTDKEDVVISEQYNASEEAFWRVDERPGEYLQQTMPDGTLRHCWRRDKHGNYYFDDEVYAREQHLDSSRMIDRNGPEPDLAQKNYWPEIEESIEYLGEYEREGVTPEGARADAHSQSPFLRVSAGHISSRSPQGVSPVSAPRVRYGRRFGVRC